jgi:voltage-gated potassium channel
MLSVVTSIAGPLYLAVVMGVLIGRYAGGNRQV